MQDDAPVACGIAGVVILGFIIWCCSSNPRALLETQKELGETKTDLKVSELKREKLQKVIDENQTVYKTQLEIEYVYKDPKDFQILERDGYLWLTYTVHDEKRERQFALGGKFKIWKDVTRRKWEEPRRRIIE